MLERIALGNFEHKQAGGNRALAHFGNDEVAETIGNQRLRGDVDAELPASGAYQAAFSLSVESRRRMTQRSSSGIKVPARIVDCTTIQQDFDMHP
jgi:hypothetical protein